MYTSDTLISFWRNFSASKLKKRGVMAHSIKFKQLWWPKWTISERYSGSNYAPNLNAHDSERRRTSSPLIRGVRVKSKSRLESRLTCGLPGFVEIVHEHRKKNSKAEQETQWRNPGHGSTSADKTRPRPVSLPGLSGRKQLKNGHCDTKTVFNLSEAKFYKAATCKNAPRCCVDQQSNRRGRNYKLPWWMETIVH